MPRASALHRVLVLAGVLALVRVVPVAADDTSLPTEAGDDAVLVPPESEAEQDAEEEAATHQDAEATPPGADPWAEAGIEDEEPDEDPSTRPRLRYFLERVRIDGNARTHAPVIRARIPLSRGDVITPESGQLEAIAWALRGTGFFDRVSLRLERGSRRGWVVLVVEVRERNTIVVQQFVPGVSEGLSRTTDPTRDITPYIGFGIAETNLLGTGSALSVQGLMSSGNQGIRIAYTEPRLFGSRYAVRLSPFFNNAREYFGNPPVKVTGSCDPIAVPDCSEALDAQNAVVFYRRGGLDVGAGRAIGVPPHLSLDYQAEIIHVRSEPEAASQVIHGQTVPIDFQIDPGTTFNSVLKLALVHDRRDDPGLTRRGLFVRLEADVGTRLLGGRYDFMRLQGLVRGWVPVAPNHVLRFSGFAGAAVGYVPFFYAFHTSDLTDLIPSRFLEMEIDRRPPPDLLGTSIQGTRIGDIAGRIDVQYEYVLYATSGRRPVRRVHAYANVGLYSVADLATLQIVGPTYSGLARLPIDLTFDLGIRVDTDIGVFDFGLSNVVGFVPWW